MTTPTDDKIVPHVRKALTPEQRRQLEAAADIPDEEIDFSDIPEATDAFFANAVRGDYFKVQPVKRQTTLRLDADILDWFKQHSASGEQRGYQTRINQALRDYVEAQRGQKKAG